MGAPLFLAWSGSDRRHHRRVRASAFWGSAVRVGVAGVLIGVAVEAEYLRRDVAPPPALCIGSVVLLRGVSCAGAPGAL